MEKKVNSLGSRKKVILRKVVLFTYFLFGSLYIFAQNKGSKFNVIAFYSGKKDLAHISFVNEANAKFPEMAASYNFRYDTTSNWNNLNKEFLSKYQVVVFLDTRPESPKQRQAFQEYMESGGSWMGFHFSAFAMQKSMYDMNWDWYHNQFLGSGEFVSNTWRPTSAILKVENSKHPVTSNLPKTFHSQPNEWYKWQNNLNNNKNIEILLSIDTSSFPLGTGPKQHEIWTSGYYPVVWTNKNYRMLYLNMGHNDMDYEHSIDSSNRTLSYTFDNFYQKNLIINGLMWLGRRKEKIK